MNTKSWSPQVTWKKVGVSHFLSVGEVTWVKDNNLQLSYKEHTPELTEWNLVIHRTQLSHAGVYECRVTDKVKRVRHVQLNVIGESCLVLHHTYTHTHTYTFTHINIHIYIHLYSHIPNSML